MNHRVINGKFQRLEKKKFQPTPADIAERAYDLAIRSVFQYLHSNQDMGEITVTPDEIRNQMLEEKVRDLSEIHEDVIHERCDSWKLDK